MGAVCPKGRPIRRRIPLQFCTTAFGRRIRQPPPTLAFIKETAKAAGTQSGFSAMAVSRLARRDRTMRRNIRRRSELDAGGTRRFIPPPTPDYTPFATKLKEANPNWVFSWGALG